MTLSLVIIIPVVSVILICVYVYFFKGNTKNVLQRYGTMPTHPKFQRVVVTVDGCDGDLDKTINSVLS